MKIIEINVSEFGRLKNTRIELGDGINIIGGNNESGKSTVMLFIRFMLYGLPKKSQKNSFRERSLSFDSHRAAGSMLIESNGRQYRIERTATGNTRTSETLKIVDMRSGELVEGDPSELFVGVGADVFESSCAVHQSRASSIDKAGAERAFENILASADESIDVSSVLESIDKIRREYKLNRGEGGLLYEINREIAELEAKQRRAIEKQLDINKLEDRLEKFEADLERVDEDIEKARDSLEVAKKVEILSRFDALTQKRQEKELLEEELASVAQRFPHENILPTEQTAADIENVCGAIRSTRQKIDARRQEREELERRSLSDFPLASTGEGLIADGGAEAIASAADLAQKKAKTFMTLGIVFAAVAVASAFASLVSTVMIGVSAAGVAGAIIFMTLSAKRRAEVKRICAKYGQSVTALGEYLDKCASDFAASQDTKHALTVAMAKLEAAEQDLTAMRNSLAALLSRKGSPSDEELLTSAAAICADIRALCSKKNEISLKIAACDALITSYRSSLDEYDERRLRAELGSAIEGAPSVAEAERALAFAERKKPQLVKSIGDTREALAAGRASAGQSPVEIGDKISALRQKLDERSRYFDALMLAKDTIERASDSMSGNVTPEISRKASEIMALVSGGKHPALRTTKQLDVSVDEDGFGFSAELLSEGTRDAAYIALRISLMLRIFGAELPPLMLDDALCQFDDGRAEVMLRIISNLSGLPLQSIIFTCHEREREICERNGIVHTYARLV